MQSSPIHAEVYKLRRNLETRARRAVPAPLKPGLRRLLDLVDPVVVARYRQKTAERRPVPPRRLRARVGEPDIERFVTHGGAVAEALTDGAARAGVDLGTCSAVLDFGCGCGRILQPLLDSRPAPSGLAGCDVDAEAIRWLQRNTPDGVDCKVNAFSPPLPFDDESFEVVYTVSILTHLDEAMQDLWLSEIRRVLRPGGLAMISVHGNHPYEVVRRGAHSGVSSVLLARLRLRGSLDDEGFVFEPYDMRVGNRGQFPGISGDYGLTFQDPGRVAQRWARWFDVVDHVDLAVNNWQDLVIARRSG